MVGGDGVQNPTSQILIPEPIFCAFSKNLPASLQILCPRCLRGLQLGPVWTPSIRYGIWVLKQNIVPFLFAGSLDHTGIQCKGKATKTPGPVSSVSVSPSCTLVPGL